MEGIDDLFEYSDTKKLSQISIFRNIEVIDCLTKGIFFSIVYIYKKLAFNYRFQKTIFMLDFLFLIDVRVLAGLECGADNIEFFTLEG